METFAESVAATSCGELLRPQAVGLSDSALTGAWNSAREKGWIFMKRMTLAAAATFALGAALAFSTPAAAQLARSPAALGVSAVQDLKTDVQWRGRRH